MPSNSHISRLIYRRLLGLSTPAEQSELDAWLAESEDNRRFYAELTSPGTLASEMEARSAIDPRRPAADMTRRIVEMHRKHLWHTSLRVAAILIVLIGVAALWLFNRPVSTSEPSAPLVAEAAAPLTIDDITAGTTRATITDGSGRTVLLTDRESGQDAASHLLAATSARAERTAPRQLCLDVPRGGEFKVVLEDSTEVWLNAQSTLRYPETFTASERRVKVSGEAYFKIHRDTSRPFYVETDKQLIRVYGTTFNVRAYNDEEAIYTTLESGSISLTGADENLGELFLSRGHQAVLTRDDDRVKLSVVDPALVTSWHTGRFVFEDQPLER
ncbi:MAG: FecR domain-containing protein, partial [Duncaniella sp.]|nr:FecR domain-containing protein [Duncaniella sp.]